MFLLEPWIMAAAVWSWTAGTEIKANRSSTTDTPSPLKCPLLKLLRPSMNMLLKWVHQNVHITKYGCWKRLCNVVHLPQASPYPLILSLENHCSVEQQTVMAQHLRSILGDKLLKKPLDGLDTHTLPSPEVEARFYTHTHVSTSDIAHLCAVPLKMKSLTGQNDVFTCSIWSIPPSWLMLAVNLGPGLSATPCPIYSSHMLESWCVHSWFTPQ